MWFSQKWWPWPWLLSDFKFFNFWSSLNQNTSYVKKSGWSVQWYGLYIANWRTDKQTNKQTDRQTDRQTDERALLECILCKIGLTDWVIYLVDWQWQRSRTQSIGPNDSNEKCAMSRVLFGINIAAIQKIRDLDLLHLTLTFFLDLWPWYLTLRLIYYYLDALKKTLQKCIVLTSRDAKTAPHMLERRPTYWLVFCQ